VPVVARPLQMIEWIDGQGVQCAAGFTQDSLEEQELAPTARDPSSHPASRSGTPGSPSPTAHVRA